MLIRVIGYGSIMTILILGILGFITFFIVETVIESNSLASLLDNFIWKNTNDYWKNFGADYGTELTSEYSVMWSRTNDLNHLTLLPNQLESTTNIVFDRTVNLKKALYTGETVSAEYSISNNIADVQAQEIRILNPAILRYLDKSQATSTSELWVYVVTRLFQDRTKGLDRLKLSYSVQKIFLDPKFTISEYQEAIENKYGYNSVNFQRVFLDVEFGLFTPDGLFFWLETLYYQIKDDVSNYEYNRNLLKNRISWSDSFNTEMLIDFIYQEMGLADLYKSVMLDYEKQIVGLCGEQACTDNQMNLLQWGTNVYNKLLSNKVEFGNDDLRDKNLQKNFNVSHVVTLDVSDTTNIEFSLELSASLMGPDSPTSILNLQNSKFLEAQLSKSDPAQIMEKFKLETEEEANALLKYYSKVYTTLTNYSERFNIDYIKSEFTQRGLLKGLELTTTFTYNNITSIKLRDKITEQKLTCREVFNVMPYLDMCTKKELNIEYRDVISLFVSAMFDLPDEKEAREEIKQLMNQTDTFIENLFSGSSMLKFNELVDSILIEIGKDYQCQDSCRTVLGQSQFIEGRVFEDHGFASLMSQPGNDELIDFIPEIGAYIDSVIQSMSS